MVGQADPTIELDGLLRHGASGGKHLESEYIDRISAMKQLEETPETECGLS